MNENSSLLSTGDTWQDSDGDNSPSRASYSTMDRRNESLAQDKVTLHIVGCQVEVNDYNDTIQQMKTTFEETLVRPVIKSLSNDDLVRRREKYFSSQMHDELYGDEVQIRKERVRTRRLSEGKASLCNKAVDPATLEVTMNDAPYQAKGDENGGNSGNGKRVNDSTNKRCKANKIYPDDVSDITDGNVSYESLWSVIYRAITTGTTSTARPSKDEMREVSHYLYGDNSIRNLASRNASQNSAAKQQAIQRAVAVPDISTQSTHGILHPARREPSRRSVRPSSSVIYDGSALELSKSRNVLLPDELTRLSESSDTSRGGRDRYYTSSGKSDTTASDDGMELLKS